MKLLIEKGGLNANATDGDGMTGMARASGCGQLDIVKYFKSKGANANIGNLHPIYLAASNGHHEVMVFLYEQCGALLDYPVKSGDIGGRPLFAAAEKNDLVAVKMLCGWGADINAVQVAGGLGDW